MKKRILIIFLFMCMFIPKVVKAEEYDCYYYSKNKKSEVGYNLQEKHVGLFGNNSIDIIKYNGKSLNKSITGNKSTGDQIPDKCYEYVSITSTKVVTSGRTTYSFKLGDNLADVSSGDNSDNIILKLNGFSDDSKEKVCQNEIGSSINYNNDLDDLDLNIKSTYTIKFKFVTKENGKREFIVSYDGSEKSSGEFEGKDVPSVSLENVKNKKGEVAIFTVDSKYVEKYWESCIAPSMFNIKKSGSTYTLVSDRAQDNEEYVDDRPGNLDVTPIDICENDTTSLKVFQVIGYILMLIKIIVPLILIILGSVDFGKAAMSGDDKVVKDAAVQFAKRVLIGLVIFFVPTVLDFFLSLVNGVSETTAKFSNCTSCLFSPMNESKCSPGSLTVDETNNNSDNDDTNNGDKSSTVDKYGYECYYEYKNSKGQLTSVGYNKNGSVTLIKHDGKNIDKTVSPSQNSGNSTYETDKCYSFITVTIKELKQHSGYDVSYKLGNTQEEVNMGTTNSPRTAKLVTD